MNLDIYKAIVPDTPPEILSWRMATGKDFRDEVWDGVYHVVDEKTSAEIDFENELESWLITKWACSRGGRVFRDTRLAKSDQTDFDFRVPSICLYAEWSTDTYQNGMLVDPPDVVIEVFEGSGFGNRKTDFYRDLGVDEIWKLDPATRICELTACEDCRVESLITNRKRTIFSPVTGIEIKAAAESFEQELFDLALHSSLRRRPK